MKQALKSTLSVILIAVTLLSLFACAASDPWADATYTSDTSLGEGATTFTFKVRAEDKTVTFTVSTDKQTVGEALLELGLISGSVESYGLYVKEVNGIRADYDKDGYYWALYIGSEYASLGVDSTAVTPGAEYTFAREK